MIKERLEASAGFEVVLITTYKLQGLDKLSMGWLKNFLFRTALVFLLLLFSFAASELILRFDGRYLTLSEQAGDSYISVYGEGSRDESLYRYRKSALDTFRTQTIEFLHERAINDIGFTDPRLPTDIDTSNTIRILALGDSFTEGMGASYDESWVRVLEENLNIDCPRKKWVVYNAGICGSDPYFAQKNLEFLAPKLHPDVVIELMNPSDFHDVYTRGGWERFLPDGTVRYSRQSPRWESFYKKSHLVRWIVHELFNYNQLFTKDKMEHIHAMSSVPIINAVDSSRKYSEAIGAIFIPLFFSRHPPEGFRSDFTPDSQFVSLAADKLPCFLDLNPFIKQHGGPKLFWPQDFHCTPEGYRLIGERISQYVEEIAGCAKTN